MHLNITHLLFIFGLHEGCCYSILLKNSHPCVEGAMHHDCPVCFEVMSSSPIYNYPRIYINKIALIWTPHTWYPNLDVQFLFESRNDVTVLPCGHTIHTDCFKEMRDHFQWVLQLNLRFNYFMLFVTFCILNWYADRSIIVLY